MTMPRIGDTSQIAPDGGTPRSGRNSASSAIIRAVASHTNTEVTELPPLYDSIDPDALDALFAPGRDGRPRSRGEVTFPYAGYQVTLTADRDITLDPIGDGHV